VTAIHEHNERARTGRVLEWLAAGESLALVSDAGTPLVSDPGGVMVREAIRAGHEVIPIPGPSATTTALAASGLATGRFLFLGFAPRKGRERRAWLRRVRDAEEPVVVFESPKRLAALLDELAGLCGSDRPAAVARELTKVHEEIRRHGLGELAAHFREHPPRGEVTVVVGAVEAATGEVATDRETSEELARAMLDEGLPPSGVARVIAAGCGMSRNAAYRLAQELASAEDRSA